MELQKSVGALGEAIGQLTVKIDAQGKSIDRIKYILAFAAGGIFVGSVIIGYIFDKRFDEIFKVLAP